MYANYVCKPEYPKHPIVIVQRVGEQADDAAGHLGRVAEGAGHVAVLGTDFQQPRHHGADAGGGQEVHHRRQNVEGRHEAHHRR